MSTSPAAEISRTRFAMTHRSVLAGWYGLLFRPTSIHSDRPYPIPSASRARNRSTASSTLLTSRPVNSVIREIRFRNVLTCT